MPLDILLHAEQALLVGVLLGEQVALLHGLSCCCMLRVLQSGVLRI